MAKGKFLYVVKKDGENRVFIKDETFSGYPEGTKFDLDTGVGLSLSSLSTDDLLKLKAQIASYLETRMDLDEVVEGNFEKLQTQIRKANGITVAKLLRQTLDRLDIITSDKKRAETRFQILSDEMKRRMLENGDSEVKYDGFVNVSYKSELVFNVGEGGWSDVYNGIVSETLRNVLHQDHNNEIINASDKTYILNKVISAIGSKIEDMIGADGDFSLHEKMKQIVEDINLDLTDVEKKVVENLCGYINNKGINNTEAFAILQKRFTPTNIKDLISQGEELPKGVEQITVHKIKVLRNKK